jgi:teichuronic acid biosynthesis glycosyltransferase TuaG
MVDDCSSDGTHRIASQIAESDSRITLIEHSTNQGAAAARNTGLRKASSRYIAYLDSDDYWLPRKLEKQIAVANDGEHPVVITSYHTVSENGDYRNTIHVPSRTGRRQFLMRPPTCTHTILVDTKVVDKSLLEMPRLERRQDAATWLQILSAGFEFYGMQDVLACNRKRSGSLSANRWKAVQGTWYLYRHVAHLPLWHAAPAIVSQLLNALWKRRVSRLNE